MRYGFLLLCLPIVAPAADAPSTLAVLPAAVDLQGARARQQLIVVGGLGAAGDADLTLIAS